jgi:ribose transport system ATP-binding protein
LAWTSIPARAWAACRSACNSSSNCRVLFSGAKIIILDEPTSALSPPEVARLFDALRRLKSQGRTIVFISHFLDDVLAISDRVTVFRNGRKVVTEATAALDKDAVISHMIGRGSAEMHMGETTELAGDDSRPVVLDVSSLSDGHMVRDVSLKLRGGEITGVYGFMGCGQIELARALFGKGQLDGGAIAIDGKPVRFRSTADARRAGIAFVPESRGMMLFRTEQVYKNISIAILGRIHRWLLKPRREGRSPKITSRICRYGRRAPTSHSAIFPAATSRRSPWQNG